MNIDIMGSANGRVSGILLSDTFTEAGATLLTAHTVLPTELLGSAYLNKAGTMTCGAGTNTITQTGTTAGYAFAYIDVGVASVNAKIDALPSAARNAGLIIRNDTGAGTDGYYIVAGGATGSEALTIHLLATDAAVAGPISIGTFSAARTIVVTDDGSTITAYMEDNKEGTTISVDTVLHNTNTFVGPTFIGNIIASTLSNFIVYR